MTRSYSRLQRLEERRNFRKAVLFMLGTIILIALTVTTGFNLLTRVFMFMGNINSSNKPVAKTDFIPPSPPVFLSSFDATNSATVTIRGAAEPGATVYLTQNTNPAGDVVTSDDGFFVFGEIHLREAQNIFSAVAIDGSGNKSQVSNQLSISYSSKAPTLKILTPADKHAITGSNPGIQIQGITDPDVRLIINDRVVIVGTDGTFNYKIVLNPGDNQISVNAVNEAGNFVQKQLTVTYTP